jgi:hypothetical protein
MAAYTVVSADSQVSESSAQYQRTRHVPRFRARACTRLEVIG